MFTSKSISFTFIDTRFRNVSNLKIGVDKDTVKKGLYKSGLVLGSKLNFLIDTGASETFIGWKQYQATPKETKVATL